MLKTTEKNRITKENLTGIFESGFTTEQKMGLEFEKLPVYKKNFKAVQFKSISTLFERFKPLQDWEDIKENSTTIGLKNGKGTITLEPGCQFELSINPYENLHQIEREIKRYNLITNSLADELDIYWLGYGIQPVSTYKDIGVIPKKRYEYMTNYLPKMGEKALVLMRETAGIQTSVDYKDEEDAILKLKTALKLSPFISAMFANSPIRNGEDTGYKSFRASSWLRTDNCRCGLISKGLFEKETAFSFRDYAEILLDIPTIFIQKEKKTYFTNEMSFRKFLNEGFEGFYPTKENWLTHLSLFFPEVRLKSYLEIRNHDSQKPSLIPSIPAIWKGLLYDKDNYDAIENLLFGFTYFDYECIRHSTPKFGLNLEIKGHKIGDITKELVKIAHSSLKKQGNHEETLLEEIMELTFDGLTPADVILKNWHGCWNKDISKLIEWVKIN